MPDHTLTGHDDPGGRQRRPINWAWIWAVHDAEAEARRSGGTDEDD